MQSKILDGKTDEQKARMLEKLVSNIDLINSRCGSVIGTYQILEMLDQYSVELGYKKCPCCGKGGSE